MPARHPKSANSPGEHTPTANRRGLSKSGRKRNQSTLALMSLPKKFEDSLIRSSSQDHLIASVQRTKSLRRPTLKKFSNVGKSMFTKNKKRTQSESGNYIDARRQEVLFGTSVNVISENYSFEELNDDEMPFHDCWFEPSKTMGLEEEDVVDQVGEK